MCADLGTIAFIILLLSLYYRLTLDYSFGSFFTIAFSKPGLYEYIHLLQPWMVEIQVKPKLKYPNIYFMALL